MTRTVVALVVLSLVVAATVVAQRPHVAGAEPTSVVLHRRDKALLVPTDEQGEVAVYAKAVQLAGGPTYRYSYTVIYREALPGQNVLTSLHVAGDEACDLRAVTTPNRRHGFWGFSFPAPGSITWTAASGGLAPGGELHFSFTSRCAPSTGRVRAGFGAPPQRQIVAPIVAPARVDKAQPAPPASGN